MIGFVIMQVTKITRMTVYPHLTEMTMSLRVQSIEIPRGQAQPRANGCSASTTIVDASTRNLQINKNKHPD
jgi:hypothetical protein